MLDFSHVGVQNQQTFTATGANRWQTWNKPRNASFVHFFVLGAGGGGGAGFTPGAVGNSPGGSGGGSGAQCSIVFLASFLPDVIYILAGLGGEAGSPQGAFTDGSAGTNSLVTIYPLSSTPNYILCQAVGGGGGRVPTNGTTPGAAGIAAGATSISTACLAGLGFASWGTAATNISLAGQAGATATGANDGNGITLPTTGLLVTGGAAGGSIRNAAGASRLGGSFGTIAGGVFPLNTGGDGSRPGSNGFQPIPKLQFYYGGTGGASGATQTGTGPSGGNGGAGAYGCGGGGGGGSFTNNTTLIGQQSSGGRGGDGLVIVTWW
jgi:hypothetical protein